MGKNTFKRLSIVNMSDMVFLRRLFTFLVYSKTLKGTSKMTTNY